MQRLYGPSTVILWSLIDGIAVHEWQCNADWDGVDSAGFQFSPDNQFLAGSNGTELCLWKVCPATQPVQVTLPTATFHALRATEVKVAWLSHGLRLVVQATRDRRENCLHDHLCYARFHVFDAQSMQILYQLDDSQLDIGWSHAGFYSWFVHNGRWLIVRRTHQWQLLDLEKKEKSSIFSIPADVYTREQHDQYILCSSSSSSPQVSVMDMTRQKFIAVLLLPGSTPFNYAFHVSSDKTMVIGILRGKMYGWDIATGGEPIFSTPCPISRAYPFSDSVVATFSNKEGYIAASCNDDTLRLFRASNGICQQVATFTGHHGRVTRLALTSDARYLCYGTTDGGLYIHPIGHLR